MNWVLLTSFHCIVGLCNYLVRQLLSCPGILAYVCIFFNLAHQIRGSHKLELISIQYMVYKGFTDLFQYANLTGVVLPACTLYREESITSRRHRRRWFSGEYFMNAYVYPSHSIKETWYNLRSGLCFAGITNTWKWLCRTSWWRAGRLYWTSGQLEAYQLKP